MTYQTHAVPDSFLNKWQDTSDVMARIFDVPAGLIMRVHPEQIEVLVSSHSEDNPYEACETAPLNSGLYCETVMRTKQVLQVPNALNDELWKNNPDIALNMISYLGVPLIWPDQSVFGTICVLDSKERTFHSQYINLLWEIKKGIESDFKLIRQQEQLIASNTELRIAIEQQRADAKKLTQSNQELNAALATVTQMQAQLLHSEKMAALGSLVAGISHELNTPIGNGLMAASTLQSDVSTFMAHRDQGLALTRSEMQQLGESLTLGTEILMRNLSRAAELVRSFKQIAVDQTSMIQRRFSLNTTVSDTLIMLRPLLHRHGCRIETHMPDHIEMDGDPGAIEQVLIILINNALIHAFPEKTSGTISISAELSTTDEVHLHVTDNGIGIPEANLSRLFDPFFTTRLGQGGSGLGLHIADNLVSTALHGQILVTSTEGQGACFTLVLPCVAAN